MDNRKNHKLNKILSLSLILLCLFASCGVRDDSAASLVKLEDMKMDILPENNGVEDENTQIDSIEDEGIIEEALTEEGPEKFTISINFAGDVTMGSYEEQEYSYTFDQEYDWAEDKNTFFAGVRDIFEEDDLTVVNLEGVLTTATEKKEDQTYCLKGRPEYVKLLSPAGIEAVGFANNHRLDFGTAGSNETVKLLEDNGIVYAYDKNVGIYTVPDKNIDIGIIAVNEIAWGQGVEKLIKEGMDQLKEQEVDLIVVFHHWGIEKEYIPDNYQQQLGKKCIDWGADMVIGAHPHVLQGVEKYNGKYIVYSLGNFCFGANRNPEDKDCMIVNETFEFVDGVKQENPQIKVIPCSVSSIRERNNFRPTVAAGDENTRIINKINELSAPFGVEFDYDGREISN